MLAGAALAFATAGCREGANLPPVSGHSPAVSAEQFLVGMETRLVQAGVLRADVEADTAFLFDNSRRIEMYVVHVVFYTSTGVNDGVMTAHRTTYDTRVDSLQAFGNVKVVSVEGRVLTTPYLRYNKMLNEISSDSAFTLTEADRTVTGIGFKSDPGMINITVKKNVRGAFGAVKVPDR